VTRRGPVRARNVVTNDKDANKDAPLDVVEIEECLSVRDAHRGSPSAASRCLRIDSANFVYVVAHRRRDPPTPRTTRAAPREKTRSLTVPPSV
jgi:hypothetical protein